MNNKGPSFIGRKAASESSAKAKRANRSVGSNHELQLLEALEALQANYVFQPGNLPGRPDFILPDRRVAIFCDGDFWHGRDWENRRRKLERGHNADYWVKKIEANMLRDAKHTEQLESLGWTVIRIWETDIRRDPVMIANSILARTAIEETLSSTTGQPGMKPEISPKRDAHLKPKL